MPDALTYLVVMLGPLLLALLAVGFLWAPSMRRMISWLGLLIVVTGTYMAFRSSATWVERGSLGAGVGFAVTFFYGLLGLAVVLGGLWASRSRFLFAPAAFAVGLFYVASFYAYLPPWSMSGFQPGFLLMLGPGIVLVVLGVLMWWRHGVIGRREESTGTRSVVRSRLLTGSLSISLLLLTGVYIDTTVSAPPPHVEVFTLTPQPGSVNVGSTSLSARLDLTAGAGVAVERTPIVTMDGEQMEAAWTVLDGGNMGRISTGSFVLEPGEHVFAVQYWDTTGAAFTHTWNASGAHPYPDGPPPTPS